MDWPSIIRSGDKTRRQATATLSCLHTVISILNTHKHTQHIFTFKTIISQLLHHRNKKSQQKNNKVRCLPQSDNHWVETNKHQSIVTFAQQSPEANEWRLTNQYWVSAHPHIEQHPTWVFIQLFYSRFSYTMICVL